MSHLLFVFVVVSIIEFAFYLALPRLLALRGIDARRRGPFGMTLVFETCDEDGTPVRLLNVNGTYQSACYLTGELWSELVCVYHRIMVERIDEMGSARNVLVIGGGGYSLPKYLLTHTRRMRVCVVEIDPQITELARERFDLDRLEDLAGGRLELVCDDGWAWLKETERRFDVIVNDAFSAGRPLAQMSTREGACLVARHLTEGGMYLANVRTPLEGPRARHLERAEEAFRGAFDKVQVVPENPDEPRRLANNVLVATDPQPAPTSTPRADGHVAA